MSIQTTVSSFITAVKHDGISVSPTFFITYKKVEEIGVGFSCDTRRKTANAVEINGDANRILTASIIKVSIAGDTARQTRIAARLSYKTRRGKINVVYLDANTGRMLTREFEEREIEVLKIKTFSLRNLSKVVKWVNQKIAVTTQADAVPTQGSAKLITSGAVYEAIDKAMSGLTDGDSAEY